MVNLRLCPCCNIQYDIVDMISIDGINKCYCCVKNERIAKIMNWENIKSVHILKIKNLLTEIDSVSVFDKNIIDGKLEDLNESWVILKTFIR